MQSKTKLKFFFYLLIITFISIISYSLLINSRGYVPSFTAKPKEVVVYKEEDVIKLLQSIQQKQHDSAGITINSEIIKEIKVEDEKTNAKHNYLKKYPDFLNCRKDDLKKWISGSNVSTSDLSTYNSPAPETTHNVEYLRCMNFS